MRPNCGLVLAPILAILKEPLRVIVLKLPEVFYQNSQMRIDCSLYLISLTTPEVLSVSKYTKVEQSFAEISAVKVPSNPYCYPSHK